MIDFREEKKRTFGKKMNWQKEWDRTASGPLPDVRHSAQMLT
ncbi:hypothetical protein SBV1_1770002 [Verrucomicrobia bacterium]|nr:hypothetical protein SBV1_1770002 [Verrucomicrobiota bacterium]